MTGTESLFCLRPIADAQHAWAAIALESAEPVATARLTRLFGEQGLFEALGGLPCVVAVADIAGVDDVDSLLPAASIVLTLAARDGQQPLEAAWQRLRGLGFRLLADATADRAIWPGVDIVAATADDPAALQALAAHPGRRMATGVESLEQFENCRQAGCTWLSGDYPLRADPLKLPRGGPRQALLTQLLVLLGRDADSKDIENLVRQDAHLSYQLLRLVNSVAFSLTREITSFNQAITLLGRRQLQRWLQLLLYARHESDQARSPLLPRAALRAALMEALTRGQGAQQAEQAYMTGMFSLLDRLLGGALVDILAPLHLPGEVKGALISRAGPLGARLEIVEAAERGDCDALRSGLSALGLDVDDWTQMQVEAYRWAVQVAREA